MEGHFLVAVDDFTIATLGPVIRGIPHRKIEPGRLRQELLTFVYIGRNGFQFRQEFVEPGFQLGIEGRILPQAGVPDGIAINMNGSAFTPND